MGLIKKVVAVALLALFTAVATTGCDSTPTTKPAPPPPTETGGKQTGGGTLKELPRQ
jgi:hypothetical protein